LPRLAVAGPAGRHSAAILALLMLAVPHAPGAGHFAVLPVAPLVLIRFGGAPAVALGPAGALVPALVAGLPAALIVFVAPAEIVLWSVLSERILQGQRLRGCGCRMNRGAEGPFRRSRGAYSLGRVLAGRRNTGQSRAMRTILSRRSVLALTGGTALTALTGVPAHAGTEDWAELAADVRAEFKWAWGHYVDRAWGKDEINPVSGTSQSFFIEGRDLGLSLV